MIENRNLDLQELQHLVNECIAGKRISQNRLYAYYAPKMFPVCLRYSSGREEAEEVLQEGFIKIFTSLHQFAFKGSFEGWARKIMVHLAIQRFRDKKKMYAIMPVDEEIVVVDSTDSISKLSEKEIMNLIQQLPPVYKMVFNLYVFEGMKHKEIAACLKISEGTSKSNLSDARNILQKKLLEIQKISEKEKNCI